MIPLNKKEVKKIYEAIKSQWDAEVRLDYVFLLSEKNKLYIINKEITKIDLSRLRINTFGMYFGEYSKGNLRLSIEGSQIIGKYAKKNVLMIDNENTKKWLRGEELSLNTDSEGFAVIKNKNDFLGCGRIINNTQNFSFREKFCSKKILNYVPKNRRVRISD